MIPRGAALAHMLLRVGALDPEDSAHQAAYEELMGNDVLFADVRARLEAVGYELVQFLGHLGARPARAAELAQDGPLPGTADLHSGHVRLLVWLWVQLVYRQVKAASRDEAVEPEPGREQALLAFVEEAPGQAAGPSIPRDALMGEFSEDYSKTTLKQFLTTLKRHRFVRQAGATGDISAGPALYVLVDALRMEEFVVGLARRGAGVTPEEPPGDDA